MSVASQLRERVTIQRAAVVQDAYGNESEDWADVATVWAEVVEMTAAQAERAGQHVEEHPRIVRLRHIAGLTDDLTTEDRLVWERSSGGRVMNVRSATRTPAAERSARGALWELLCTEAAGV